MNSETMPDGNKLDLVIEMLDAINERLDEIVEKLANTSTAGDGFDVETYDS